jgi:phage N-6-adenine-methyltransferase
MTARPRGGARQAANHHQETAVGSDSRPVAVAQALPDLAQAIEAAHQAAYRAALPHAIRCGELLLEAKAQVAHGQWLPWIEANLTLRPRQCQGYMRLAANRDALNAQAATHLTIDGALALVAERRAHPPGSGSVEWHTPASYLDWARQVLGEFDLVPASNDVAQQQVRALAYFTREDDGLAQQWNGRIFCNPPYADAGKFIDKLLSELSAGRATEAVLLVNAHCDTRWFHRAAAACSAICFSLGRICFEKANGDQPRQPAYGSAFIYFGQRVDRFRAAFAGQGLIMRPDAARSAP